MTVAVTDSRVRVLGNVAVNTGYYTFTAMRNGQPDPRPARFSFTYRLRDGKWLIVDHHSSSVPGGAPVAGAAGRSMPEPAVRPCPATINL